MADISSIAEGEHQRWLTPTEALLALRPLSPDKAAILLQDGARTEQIRTSAKAFFCEPKNLPGFSMAEHGHIPAYYWAHISKHAVAGTFWDTGAARFWFGITPYFPHSTAVLCADVRFNREDVEKAKPPIPRQILAEALQAISDTPPPPPPTGELPQTKGPPLAPKALVAWFEAYKLAYGAAERTLDHAWDHAKRAFPEKTVTRQAVRGLMPGGKPGPRSKS
jgi:hypothetical protein